MLLTPGTRLGPYEIIAPLGAGGVGSLVVEYLARLGVGTLVVIDPDRVDVTNLSRVVDATDRDALSWLRRADRPGWLRRIGRRFARHKVDIARRVARRASPGILFEARAANVVDADAAQALLDCDFLFLAADTMQARLVFNAIVHQYLIPGVAMGSKVIGDEGTGELRQVFSVVRFVSPDRGCLFPLAPKDLRIELSACEKCEDDRADSGQELDPGLIGAEHG